MDENGNWYRGGEGADEGADEGTTDEGTTDEGTTDEGTTDEDADGLTDAERAILADLDGPRR